MLFDLDLVQRVYAKQKQNLANVRKWVNRPLTLTEKILFTHLVEIPNKQVVRAKDYVDFLPDRVGQSRPTPGDIRRSRR